MKHITIKLDEETHKEGKIRAIMKDMSFMEYVVELIKKDLETARKPGKDQSL